MQHSIIPDFVYYCLRSVHEMRMRRIDDDIEVPHLSNAKIFEMMPDRKQINWNKDEQQPLIDATLAAMAATVMGA